MNYIFYFIFLLKKQVFATEFFCTFMLTYFAFTIVWEEAERSKKTQMKITHVVDEDSGMTLYASTPQAKSGFAPFCIGLIVFALSMFGGSSGIAMNPVRMLGPAIFSGGWDYFYVYTIAEFLGSGLAALMVTYIHPYGIDEPTNGNGNDTNGRLTSGGRYTNADKKRPSDSNADKKRPSDLFGFSSSSDNPILAANLNGK